MSSNNPVQNIKNYVSGSHRFINIGTGSDTTPTNTLVTLTKRTVMIIESCNIGIGTTLPRETLDVIGNTYISQNLGIGTTIIGSYGLNVVGNIYSSGNITAANYIGGSSTLAGNLITSNLIVLGSNTIVNTYTQQSSNFSICNVSGTGPALSVIQKGIGIGYPIADFYDLDVSTTVPSLRIADGGNIGIGTTIPVTALHVQGNIYSSMNIGIGTTISRQALDITGSIITTGNIGIGTTIPGSLLQIDAGTTIVPPLKFTSGTNLTTPVAGTFEYDGSNFYGTTDTTSSRGYIPNIQIFRLTADGSTFGPGVTNYFGANSVMNLVENSVYDLEANCYFTKIVAGVFTVRFITSVDAKNINGTILYNSGGSNVANAFNCIIAKSATTSNIFSGSGTIDAGATTSCIIRSIIETGISATTMNISFIQSGSGTLTPLQGSYYKITRLPSGNTGSFA